MDYHDILGVRPNASKDEIELAYRGRRTQYHPDKYTNADSETLRWATAKMQEVNEAYAALSGSSPRAQSATASGSAHKDPRAQPSAVEIPNFRDVVSQHVASLRGSPRAYFAPHIPHAKLHNALASYGHGLDAQGVIVVIDSTLMGGAKEGIMVTTTGLRTKELMESPLTWTWDDIHRIEIGGSHLCINGARVAECSMAEPQRLVVLFSLVQEYVDFLKTTRQTQAQAARTRGGRPVGPATVSQAECAAVFEAAKTRLLDLCDFISPLEQQIGRELVDRDNAAGFFGFLEESLRDPELVPSVVIELVQIQALSDHALTYATEPDHQIPPSVAQEGEGDSQLVGELRYLLNLMARTRQQKQETQTERFFRR
ncbi:MAG: J domain-containing protein [Pseudomonadota bacterium]